MTVSNGNDPDVVGLECCNSEHPSLQSSSSVCQNMEEENNNRDERNVDDSIAMMTHVSNIQQEQLQIKTDMPHISATPLSPHPILDMLAQQLGVDVDDSSLPPTGTFSSMSPASLPQALSEDGNKLVFDDPENDIKHSNKDYVASKSSHPLLDILASKLGVHVDESSLGPKGYFSAASTPSSMEHSPSLKRKNQSMSDSSVSSPKYDASNESSAETTEDSPTVAKGRSVISTFTDTQDQGANVTVDDEGDEDNYSSSDSSDALHPMLKMLAQRHAIPLDAMTIVPASSLSLTSPSSLSRQTLGHDADSEFDENSLDGNSPTSHYGGNVIVTRERLDSLAMSLQDSFFILRSDGTVGPVPTQMPARFADDDATFSTHDESTAFPFIDTLTNKTGLGRVGTLLDYGVAATPASSAFSISSPSSLSQFVHGRDVLILKLEDSSEEEEEYFVLLDKLSSELKADIQAERLVLQSICRGVNATSILADKSDATTHTIPAVIDMKNTTENVGIVAPRQERICLTNQVHELESKLKQSHHKQMRLVGQFKEEKFRLETQILQTELQMETEKLVERDQAHRQLAVVENHYKCEIDILQQKQQELVQHATTTVIVASAPSIETSTTTKKKKKKRFDALKKALRRPFQRILGFRSEWKHTSNDTAGVIATKDGINSSSQSSVTASANGGDVDETSKDGRLSI